MTLFSLYKWIGRRVYQKPVVILLGCLVFTLFGAFWTSKIEIKADLTALLPSHFASVKGLDELKEKYGGVGYLLLAIETTEPDKALPFIKAVVPELQKVPGVRYVSHKRPVEFFLRHFPLYIKIEDLKEIEQKLIRQKEDMKKGANPLFDELLFSLDDGPSFSDILSRYERKDGVDYATLTEYYQNEEGTLFALLIKPSMLSMNLQETRSFVQRIQDTVNQRLLSDAGLGAQLRISYGGDFVKALEQEHHLKEQMGRISGIILAILMLVLIVYYRRLSPVILIGVPLASAILWTGGLVYMVLGHVNLVTGFSAAVLAGLGSDYGIYLLSRYLQERDAGLVARKAFEQTFSRTSVATRGSALTTMMAFGVLSLSGFKGFSEFGIIGMIGTFFNLIAMHSFLPALLVIFDRHRVLEREKIFFPWSPQLNINRRWLRFSLPIVILFLSFATVTAAGIRQVLHLHYDRQQMENTSLHAYQVDKIVNPLFNNSLYPSVVMVPGGAGEEKDIVDAIQTQATLPLPLQMIKGATGLGTFVPESQEEKVVIIERIQRQLRGMKMAMVGKVKVLRKHFEEFNLSDRVSRSGLPPEIIQTFTAPTGGGSLVFLFPKMARDTTERVLAFSDQVSDIRLQDGTPVVALGDSMIIADIIRLVEKEAPLMIVAVLFLCFLDLFFDFRSFKAACFLTFMLGFSVLITLGGMLVFDLKFNFFNLVAPPIIIGTGCDSFIHFYQRYRERKHQVLEVINSMAPSISVANLTTVIGFGGLIMTDNAGLRSTGWMVMIGMAAVTLTALLFLPACLVLRQKWRSEL